MLTGHVQDMIQRIAANRRKRQPRSKKEKMLDLLRTDRNGHTPRQEEFAPETLERIKAAIREQARKERRRKRIIGWILAILALGVAVYLVISYLNYNPEYKQVFEIDENNKLRRCLTAASFRG